MSEDTVQENVDATETPGVEPDAADIAFENAQKTQFGDDLSEDDLEVEDLDVDLDAKEETEKSEEEGQKPPTEPEIETEPKTVQEEVKEEVVDEFKSLRDAGYNAASITQLINLAQNNPKVVASIKEAIEGPVEVVQEQDVKVEAKDPQDFMPDGKQYSAVDALERGTESFKAHAEYIQSLTSQVFDKRTAEQVKAQQQEVAKQRQIANLKSGAENLKTKYNVTDKEIEEFGVELKTKTDVNPLEVAYLGMKHEALVQKAVEREATKMAEKMAEDIIRTKHNGKIKSSTTAETGLAKGTRVDPFNDVDAIINKQFGE